MHDISNLAITGSGLTEARERKQQQHDDSGQQADDNTHSRSAAMSPSRRSLISHPTSPRSTRSSRLRRQRSLSNKPDSSAVSLSSPSLQQLGAVHEQLQAMITSKADEHSNNSDHHHPSTEPAAPPTGHHSKTVPSASASTSPLLQRLMALVKEAESQQQRQQPTVQPTTLDPLPTTPQPAAVIGVIPTTGPVHAVHPSMDVSDAAHTRASMRPLSSNGAYVTSASHWSSVPSASSSVASTMEVSSLSAAASASTTAASVQASQSQLSQQLHQLSEYKQQAVAECLAVQVRLQAAIAELQSLQAQSSSELARIETEYVRAVEQCKTQHTQRMQRLHGA